MNSNKVFVLLLEIVLVSFRSFELEASTINEDVRMFGKQVEELSRDIVAIKKIQLDNSIAITNILAMGKHELAGTLSSTLIKLNVGGKEFETTFETLTRINNTYFTSLFAQVDEVQVDDKGRIFIDRDGELFSYVLSYLRTDKLVNIDGHHKRLLLIDEAKFYRLPYLISLMLKNDKDEEEEEWERLRNRFFMDGTLLKFSHQNTLNEFYGVATQRWKLLYKATKDGFTASAFHSLCDNKGPTMTIILSNNGYLFGGFTKESWAGEDDKTDPTAFIFTLTNPHFIAATKFVPLKDGEDAMKALKSHGPIFGGDDIFVVSNSNRSDKSSIFFPKIYRDTTGKGRNLFTGARNFVTSDIEVFNLA